MEKCSYICRKKNGLRNCTNTVRLKSKKDENGKEIWKPLHRGALMPLDDVAIISKYNSSVMKMYKKYRSVKGDFGADYKTKSGTKRCEFYNEGFRRNNNIAPEFVDIMPKYRGR